MPKYGVIEMPSLEEIRPVIEKLDGASALLGKKEIKELPGILWENEFPEAIIQGMYNNGLGILVCTNSRLIFVDKGLLYGVKVEDFPLKNISSIQYETGMLMGKITIFTSGNRADIEQADKKQVRNFAEFVRAKISGQSIQQQVVAEPATSVTQTAVSNTDNMINQLERLAKLKEQGILTDEEFATQKAKILAGM